MNANELRIGNLIQWESTGDIESVVDIKTSSMKYHTINDINIKDCKAIPLTEEWLLRFGFSKYDSGRFINFYREELIFGVTLNKETGKFNLAGEYTYDFPCNYVHQLQNLYLALTGEELEIK